MIWLVGTGIMGCDYGRVLDGLGIDCTAIGRSQKAVDQYVENVGQAAVSGGIEEYLKNNPAPQKAIVSVDVINLAKTCELLLAGGVKSILLEKPGGVDLDEIRGLSSLADKYGANVVLGYNRRFYNSVLMAEKMLEEDGGVSSFSFEFTEWSHLISKEPLPSVVLDKWFLANSSHVVDLAFHIGGQPQELTSYSAGKLEWHPTAVFTGAGKTRTDVLFSYHADWSGPGRWWLEVLSKRRRYIFRPFEKLHIQQIGSIQQTLVEPSDNLDSEYKPGLYRMVRAFVNDDLEKFCTIQDQLELAVTYNKIAGYE